MTRKSSVFLWILFSVIAMFVVTFDVAEVIADTYKENYGKPCDFIKTGETKEKKCFKTPISGYSFRVIEVQNFINETCGTSAIGIDGFPTNIFASGSFTGKLWCYEFVPPIGGSKSSLNQVALTLPLNLYKPPTPGAGTNYTNLITGGTYDQSAGFKFSVFTFDSRKGCSGDPTTNFEIGDNRACGMKWTANIPSGGRFWYKTSKEAEPGVDITEMVPKIGNGIEPGLILGAAGASPYTPSNASVCQPIEDKIALKITYDEVNCPSKVETCDTGCTNCETTSITNVKASVKNLGTEIISHKSVKEIGFLLGDKYCQSGQAIIGTNSCGLVNFSGTYVYRCW